MFLLGVQSSCIPSYCRPKEDRLASSAEMPRKDQPHNNKMHPYSASVNICHADGAAKNPANYQMARPSDDTEDISTQKETPHNDE